MTPLSNRIGDPLPIYTSTRGERARVRNIDHELDSWGARYDRCKRILIYQE